MADIGKFIPAIIGIVIFAIAGLAFAPIITSSLDNLGLDNVSVGGTDYDLSGFQVIAVILYYLVVVLVPVGVLLFMLKGSMKS